MDTLIEILLLNLALALALMMAGWVVSLLIDNVTIADCLWGVGFVGIAWTTCILSDGNAVRRWMLALMVTFWGVRLSIYLGERNWGRGEDPRYASWRKKCGSGFWLQSLFKVFGLQALFMWIIALPLQWAQMASLPGHLTALDIAGAVIWLVGFLFETVGDAQLAAFKADPANRGKVMDRGLWAYSRHPNYFGEALMWWAIFLIALATPGGWWTVIGPLAITAVLLKMTGIALTESLLLAGRPGYAEYIRKTSAFIPWFPGKGRRSG